MTAPSATARVAFRDRAVVDVLDLALRFLVVHARAYAKVAAIVLVPALAVGLLAGSVMGWPRAWVVVLPVALCAEVPFTVLASRLVFEDTVRVRDVLRDGLAAIPRAAGLRLLCLAGIAVGFVFLFIPGAWIAASVFFVGEILLLERGPGAFGRAQRLSSQAFADVMLGLILLGLLPVLAVVLADVAGRGVIGELLQFRPPLPVWASYGGVLALGGLILQVPFRATARFFLYLNVRTRVEGWDIQNRFVRIAVGTDRP